MNYRMVNVDSKDNHNKFWFCDVEGSSQVRNWGRVGASSQTKTFHFSSSYDAQADADKAARSKRAKGYREVAVATDKVDLPSTSVKKLATEQIKTNGDKVLSDLIDYLVKVNIHTITSNTSLTVNGGQLCSALGPITPKAIAEARNTLQRIGGYVNRNMQSSYKFTRLVEEYMTTVPMRIGMKRWTGMDVFPTMTEVREQETILNAMESFQAVSSDEKVFDVKLEKADSEVSRIQALFNKTSNRMHKHAHNRTVKAVYAIVIGTDEFSDKVGNVQELWHGTKAGNLLSILKCGMKIVPSGASHTTGRMFGDGLYFSDQSSKSFQYVIGSAPGQKRGGTDRHFMLLCEVAMGKAYTPRNPTRKIPSGYDSCFAKGGRSGVMNNEMVVYKEEQARIKYLVEFS